MDVGESLRQHGLGRRRKLVDRVTYICLAAFDLSVRHCVYLCVALYVSDRPRLKRSCFVATCSDRHLRWIALDRLLSGFSGFSMLSVQLLHEKHLECRSAKLTKLAVNFRGSTRISHELKEAASLFSDLVGLTSCNDVSQRNSVSAAIPHILDLHESRNHRTDFTAKVAFEDVLMCMKDLHKSTEVPLLRIRAEFPILH